VIGGKSYADDFTVNKPTLRLLGSAVGSRVYSIVKSVNLH
jgi:hypothetical protein